MAIQHSLAIINKPVFILTTTADRYNKFLAFTRHEKKY
jgi:hypothetical protein